MHNNANTTQFVVKLVLVSLLEHNYLGNFLFFPIHYLREPCDFQRKYTSFLSDGANTYVVTLRL